MEHTKEDQEPAMVNESALSADIPLNGHRLVAVNADENVGIVHVLPTDEGTADGVGDKTVAYIESLPNGVRKELIDGKVYDMASPTMTHQGILIGLSSDIYQYIRAKGGKCKVIMAPFAVLLVDDGKNWVEPDILVTCDRSKLDDKGCHGAPDWVIEIVSPSSKKLDYEIKMDKYRQTGVREYWIVDSKRATVQVYDFESGATAHANMRCLI